MPKRHFAPLLIALALTGSPVAATPNYTAVFLDTAGASGGSGRAIDGSAFSGFSVTPGHALLWTSSAATPIDLHPTSGSYGFTEVHAASGDVQVGQGGFGSSAHALLWHGSADSVVDLNPASATLSMGLGAGADQQVGLAAFPATIGDHAVLWYGTPQSAVDLNPATGFAGTYANDTDGLHQVGFGYTLVGKTLGEAHALLWSGTPESMVDLNPSGQASSRAWGIAGDHIVGDVGGVAALWSGPQHTWISLGRVGSAVAVAAQYQVGFGRFVIQPAIDTDHAMLWQGSAQSMVDLHDYLPPGYGMSQAWDVDTFGNVIGEARTADGVPHPVIWLVPEPGGCILLVGGAAAIQCAGNRRRRTDRHVIKTR